MAKIYPIYINQNEVNNRGEYEVYNLLKSLDDEYTIFHSVYWQISGKEKSLSETETDFLLIHPRKGFLVLEVKSFDFVKIEGRKWKSYYEMKDPYEKQLANSKKIIRHLKNKIPEIKDQFFCSCFAVCFTQIDSGKYNLGPIASKYNTIFKDELGCINEKIEEIYSYNNCLNSTAIDKKTLEKIKTIIMPTQELCKSLSSIFEDGEYELIKLNEQQKKLVDSTYRSRLPVIVYGPAGSGKTQIAISQAIDDLVCSNKVIFITNTVFSLKYIYKEIRINMKRLDLDLVDDDLLLLQAKDKELEQKVSVFIKNMHDSKYETRIIIDESQILSNEQLDKLISITFSRENIKALIFRDESQQDVLKTREFPSSVPISLSKIIRNTRDIFEEFKEYIDKRYNLEPPTRESEYKPKYQDYENEAQLIQKVVEDIRYIISLKAQAKHITILFDKRFKAGSKFIEDLKQGIGKYGLSLAEMNYDRPLHGDTITYSYIWDFQGLENNIIFLVELSESLHETVIQNRIRYTGKSRAKNILYMYSKSNSRLDIDLAEQVFF